MSYNCTKNKNRLLLIWAPKISLHINTYLLELCYEHNLYENVPFKNSEFCCTSFIFQLYFAEFAATRMFLERNYYIISIFVWIHRKEIRLYKCLCVFVNEINCFRMFSSQYHTFKQTSVCICVCVCVSIQVDKQFTDASLRPLKRLSRSKLIQIYTWQMTPNRLPTVSRSGQDDVKKCMSACRHTRAAGERIANEANCINVLLPKAYTHMHIYIHTSICTIWVVIFTFHAAASWRCSGLSPGGHDGGNLCA